MIDNQCFPCRTQEIAINGHCKSVDHILECRGNQTSDSVKCSECMDGFSLGDNGICTSSSSSNVNVGAVVGGTVTGVAMIGIIFIFNNINDGGGGIV
eukprot:Pgem_evm1s14435